MMWLEHGIPSAAIFCHLKETKMGRHDRGQYWVDEVRPYMSCQDNVGIGMAGCESDLPQQDNVPCCPQVEPEPAPEFKVYVITHANPPGTGIYVAFVVVYAILLAYFVYMLVSS
jgi:hypothetical protein